jgi:DnaJ-class molecular chaperone
LYAILELPRSCTYEEIMENAMSKYCTMDLSKEEKKEIKEAYNVLFDPELRAQYNHRRLFK